MSLLALFTDLDGTLLDAVTYSVRRALPALDSLRRRRAAVVPVTSKTADETRLWMRHLSLSGPFVYENGCAVVVPRGYFPFPVDGGRPAGDEIRVALGGPIGDVRRRLADISSDLGVPLRGFGSMTPREVGAVTGLHGDEVGRSMAREFDEPFVAQGVVSEEDLLRAASARGCRLHRGGRLFHLSIGGSKGEAVALLSEMFNKVDPDTLTAGVGDSRNDLPMLRAVRLAFLVQKPGGVYDPNVPEDAAERIAGIGPQGWRMAVEKVLAAWPPGGGSRQGAAR